jgi:Fe-S cluster assembly iron-binding protein IscA
VLTLTPTAAEAVRQIVAQAPVDDDTAGLRIAPGAPTEQGTPLEISLVESPEAADHDAGAEGAHVYLDPAASAALDDKVLDAQIQDNNVGFAILEASAQQDGAGPAA